MFDPRNYYATENENARSSYESTVTKIKTIREQTNPEKLSEESCDYLRFFHESSTFLVKIFELEEKLGDQYFEKSSLEELKALNKFLSDDMVKNYDKSWANPSYCVSVFGKENGQAMAFLYVSLRQYITHAYMHRIFKMAERNELYIEIYEYLLGRKIDSDHLRSLVTRLEREITSEKMSLQIRDQYTPDFRYNLDIIEQSDLDDLRYLFRYGHYITDNEIKTAEFFKKYPDQKIEKLSKLIVDAYIAGFKRDGKDYTKKNTVNIWFHIGQEKLIRRLMADLREIGLEPLVNNAGSTRANKQYDYDHRFQGAMFMDRDYIENHIKNYGMSAEERMDLLKQFSGTIFVDTFGEKPFKPQNKPEAYRLSEEQQKLGQEMQSRIQEISEKYVPRNETSFCIIAMPLPEIGDNFNEIFEDILRINMLDSNEYEKIQQHIINALDQAEHVHIKGRGKSQTDIKVQLHKLTDPEKQSNFLNCVADVNIPVGEVFTSPVLKGTNGVLHIENAYLSKLKYENLKLVFEDGYVKEYSCTNFGDDEEANRKYIQENLLFPHQTLPIGEFAIGTNTLAYVIAQKYGIVDILPILIVEKMGPHFAIGDTCFSFEEDKPVYNHLNEKEVIARDNEKTIARKEDPMQAYTFCHTDITIPYESIEFISAVRADGSAIDIIRDGRFVLTGTEDLNKPFETAD